MSPTLLAPVMAALFPASPSSGLFSGMRVRYPLAMAYDQALADRVSDHSTARRVSFDSKRMMGGLCFMVDGKMCIGVEKQRLMIRLDPKEAERCLALPECRPMDFTGRPMKGYLFVLPQGYESDAQLKRWLDLALEFNPRAKSSKKR